MKEDKKALKEEKKRIEKINNSVEYFSTEIREEIGALGIQKENSIFYCGNKVYKKIYLLHPAFLKDKKELFLKTLSQLFSNRIRLSMTVKSQSGKLNGSCFMTVFFDEMETFYDALNTVKAFEETLRDNLTKILGISFKCCSLGQYLNFVYMNVSGELKSMINADLFGKKSRLNLFKSFSSPEAGFFENGGKYGLVLVGKYFPATGEDFTDFLKLRDGSYQVIFDFQAISDEDDELFNMLLEEKYNRKQEEDKDIFVNLSYAVITQMSNNEDIKQTNKEAFRFFDNNGIVIMPGMNREKEIFESSCTMGLKDYHNMQNAKLDIAANLLL